MTFFPLPSFPSLSSVVLSFVHRPLSPSTTKTNVISGSTSPGQQSAIAVIADSVVVQEESERGLNVFLDSFFIWKLNDASGDDIFGWGSGEWSVNNKVLLYSRRSARHVWDCGSPRHDGRPAATTTRTTSEWAAAAAAAHVVTVSSRFRESLGAAYRFIFLLNHWGLVHMVGRVN